MVPEYDCPRRTHADCAPDFHSRQSVRLLRATAQAFCRSQNETPQAQFHQYLAALLERPRADKRASAQTTSHDRVPRNHLSQPVSERVVAAPGQRVADRPERDIAHGIAPAENLRSREWSL